MNWVPFIVVESARPKVNFGLILLTSLAFVILILMIALVEMVALQLIRWGDLRQSMKASLTMNLISSAAGILLLFIVRKPGLGDLLAAWVLFVLIEGSVLIRLRPGMTRYNWLAAVVANLASYLILILPAFLYRPR